MKYWAEVKGVEIIKMDFDESFILNMLPPFRQDPRLEENNDINTR
jgi:hypothetical protein